MDLVVCEPAGTVVLLHAEDGRWDRRVVSPAGAWPAWSPRGDRLAVSVVEQGRRITSRLDVVPRDGAPTRTLYEVPEGAPPVIAPGVPHYSLWSPDGARIAYVAPAAEGLTLFCGDVDGPLVANPIVTGAPIFPAWSPTGRLAVHAGAELLLLDGSLEQRTTLTSAAIGFRTPAFSADGESIAYATPASPGVAIMLAPTAGGASPREIQRLPGGVALAFVPGSGLLSVSLTRQPDTGLFHELWLVDTAGESAARRIHQGPFVASLWSPHGDSVILVVPGASGEGRYFARALGPDGSVLGTSDAISPSPEYRLLLSFFDQYALSHSCWSPDGRAFVLAGRPPGDGVPSSFGDPVNYVILWRPGRAAPLEVVAPGDAAFFAPGPWRAS